MKRAHVLIFGPSFATREALKQHLDAMPEILNWRTEMPFSFFLISESSADEIAHKLRRTMSDGKFFITEIPGHGSQGYLTRETWAFINDRPT